MIPEEVAEKEVGGGHSTFEWIHETFDAVLRIRGVANQVDWILSSEGSRSRIYVRALRKSKARVSTLAESLRKGSASEA